DIDVVGPGSGILAPLPAGQQMPGMRADVIDRLVLRQQLDGPVDAARHDYLLAAALINLEPRFSAKPHAALALSTSAGARSDSGNGGEHDRRGFCPSRVSRRNRLAGGPSRRS